MDGQIVRATDGRGVDGVRITVVRVGGAKTASDSVATMTGSGGFWHVESPIADSGSASGDVIVDVYVAPPSLAHPYVVRALHVPPVSREGDAFLVDRWNADPYFPYYVEFFRRDVPSQLFPNVGVMFHQTSGPSLRRPDGGSTSDVSTGTDSYGRAQMFVYNAFASDTGEIVGNAIVDLPAPFGPSKSETLRLRPTYLYRAPGIVPRMGVGPSLAYSAAVFDRASGRTLSGIQVDFKRVGGVDVEPHELTMITDNFGYAHFTLLALGTGSIFADITIHPPVGAPETFRDTIPTFDSDVPRLHANWTTGAVLPYYGIVRSFGKALPGTTVRVRRTGGIAVAPDDNTVVTDDNGVFQFSPHPLAAGTAVFDLTLTPPAPYRPFIVHNVSITTVQRDTNGFNVWVWDLEKGISGPPGTTVALLP